MIQLQSDCLYFKTFAGEAVPCSTEAVTVELIGEVASQLDPELVQHAAEAVLHYFKHDLGRTSVSVGEFSETLERVLHGLGVSVKTTETIEVPGVAAQLDLHRLARSAGKCFELAFFQRLREELHQRLANPPAILYFGGLRDCVKMLAGTRRWNDACRVLSDIIIAFLRDSFRLEAKASTCMLVVK